MMTTTTTIHDYKLKGWKTVFDVLIGERLMFWVLWDLFSSDFGFSFAMHLVLAISLSILACEFLA